MNAQENELRSARILLADDEVSMLCLVDRFLQRLGYQHIHRISRPMLIFQAIEEIRPDLIVLDLMMPGVNGFQILERLRHGTAEERMLPVLVLTGETNPAHRRRALQSGATDLLAKPFDPTEMAARVRNILSAHIFRRTLERENLALEARVSERTRELDQTMTELRRAQQGMVRQERLHAFAEMAGGVVHDFSNSLTSIIGYADLMLRSPALLDQRDTALEYLRTISTAGRDAAHIIGQLREFYRTRGEDEVIEPVDINEIAAQSVALTQPRWKSQALAAGQIIDVRLELGKVPPVLGQAAELREALTNLILNAVDAMPAGGGAITLRTRREAAHVLLEVADNGAGMSPEVRDRCLEPFFSTKGDAGTGLGLSMVFGVAKRHDGEVQVDSAPGHGTVIRLRLPAMVPVAGAQPDDVTPARPLSVLVVDDQDLPRQAVATALGGAGHRVATATNGYEAMRRMDSDRFDVVLTDFAMPGMNGTQLGTWAKERRAGQPVILLTGSGGAASAAAMPGSVDLVLLKPATHTVLIRALHQVTLHQMTSTGTALPS